MKETTKNGLKKFGKVTAYGLGLFAMFLLGVGLGNFSAKDKPVMANAETGFSLAVHSNALSTKRALDSAEYPSLNPVEGNLLLDSYAGHYALHGEGSYSTALESPNWDMYFLEVSAGDLYVFDFTPPAGVSGFAGSANMVDETGANSFYFLMTNPDYINAFQLQNSSRVWTTSLSSETPKRVIMSASSSVRGFFFQIWGGARVSVSLYDPLNMSPLASIDLGQFYDPLPMIGQTINDAPIIVYPSAGSEVNVSPVDFVSSSSNPFLFVSSGKVFDGFRIHLSRVMNLDGSQVERYATKSGDTFIAPSMSSNYVTADAFYYRLANTQQWVKVWELPYNGTDQGYNYWSYNGRWLSNSFRYVDVKLDGGVSGFSSWLPTFTLSELLALNVWTAGTLVLGDAYSNVFTMLGKGFESVGGILSIQILPFMSLGTLIFVPLVVLIIFAILRVLNK